MKFLVIVTVSAVVICIAYWSGGHPMEASDTVNKAASSTSSFIHDHTSHDSGKQ